MNLAKYISIGFFVCLVWGCQKDKSETIDFVPANSMVILKTDNLYFDLNQTQESTLISKATSDNSFLKSLQFKIKQLLSFGASRGLFEQIDESYLSLILSGAYDIGSLFIFKTNGSLLSQILDLSELENISVYSSRYQAYRIYQFNLEKFSKDDYFQQVYLCQIGSILFMSGNRLLIEDGLKYALSKTKITDNKTFKQLHQINSFSDDISFFINHRELDKVPLSHPFHPLKSTFPVGTPSWSKIQFNYANNNINLTGITVNAKPQNLTENFLSKSTSKETIPEWWKYRCDAIQKLPSDFSYWKTVTQAGSEAKITPDKFLGKHHQTCFEQKTTFRLYESSSKEILATYFSDSTYFQQIKPNLWASKSSYFLAEKNKLMVVAKKNISLKSLSKLSIVGEEKLFEGTNTFEQFFYPNRKPIANVKQKGFKSLRLFNRFFDSFKSIQTSIEIEKPETIISRVTFHEKKENEILSHEKWQLQERVYHWQPIVKDREVNFFAIGKGWLRYYDTNGNKIWETQHARFDSLTTNIGLIDWYRNGKKQLYFTRKNYFYLFPTNGRLHKKLHFSKLKSIDKFGTIYYPDRKKYRFIASSNSKVQVQDRNGNTITGFGQKKLKSPLATAPFLISKNKTDRIVFLQKNGTLNFLNRKGKVKQTISFEPFQKDVSAIYLKNKHALELGNDNQLYFINPWDSLRAQKLSSGLSPVVFDDQHVYNYKNTILQHNQTQIVSLNSKPSKWLGSENKKLLWIDNRLLVIKKRNNKLQTKQVSGHIPSDYLKASLIQDKNKVYLSLIRPQGLSLFELTL